MGTVVKLPSPRRRRRVFDRTTDEATILLFMGVRYVRDLEPESTMDVPNPRTQTRAEAPLELA